jgi:hypothetical protein
MSFSLSLVGATNIAMPLLSDSAEPVSRYWLWANVGLWTTRAVYQLVKPQGTHNPALQWGMAGAFIATDLLFIQTTRDLSGRTGAAESGAGRFVTGALGLSLEPSLSLCQPSDPECSACFPSGSGVCGSTNLTLAFPFLQRLRVGLARQLCTL